MDYQLSFQLQPTKKAANAKSGMKPRLEELSHLKEGWLNGDGKALSKSGLLWLANALEKYYDVNLPTPYLFPTPEGNILCEWTMNAIDVTLSIDIDKGFAIYNALNSSNDDMDEQVFELNKSTDWERLNQKLLSVFTN